MNLKAETLIEITKKLRETCETYKEDIIKNNPNVDFVYNPLKYAWKPHKYYLEKYHHVARGIIVAASNKPITI